MNHEVISEFYKSVDLFSEFSDEELTELAKCTELKKLSPNSLLFSENNTRSNIYIIFDGEIELFKKTPFGEEKRLSFFSKYDVLGEATLTDNSPHSTSARALLDTTVFMINRKCFFELFKKNGESAVKIYSHIARVISRRMSNTNTRIVNIGAQYESGRVRREHDLLGERDIPSEAYYGVQTLRALENFNISGVSLNFYPVIIEALAMVKMAAAQANYDLGLLSKPVKEAIVQACNEIINGKYHKNFVVDMIQGEPEPLPI